ncbi:MAG: alpha/beta fold hydrolase [Chloroflexi bacterium]|nr:alpha/beta fold hydrolase [Chloroflexota bacterium]
MPFLNLANQKIYYADSGTANSIPVVFIHGAAASHLVWGFQMRAVADIAHAIALDLPGHGRSDSPGRNTIDGYRDVILGLLDALKLERAVMVGHSMGGAVAQTLALAHPDRVAGLVLIGTGARLRVMPAILERVLSDVNQIAEIVVDNSYAATLDAGLRERAVAEFLACAPEITHGDFVACNTFDIMPRIGDIQSPTLLICGKEDKMAPPKFSKFLASKIVNAQLVLIDNAGHSVMIEQADQVNRALKEFVENIHR